MDLHVEVPALSSRDVVNSTAACAETTAAVRARVEAARATQRERFAADLGGMVGALGGADRAVGDSMSSSAPNVFCNSQMSVEQSDRRCELRPAIRTFLQRSVESLSLSARGVHRSLRVARTIADLDGGGSLTREHVAEAIQYRWLDRRREVA